MKSGELNVECCQQSDVQEANVPESIDSLIDSAEQQCKANGARLTTKRKQILSGLIKSRKALSAYELIDLCTEEFGGAIPAMSMYRILQFLEDERLVHKLSLANKYVACAHIACDHEHSVPQFLICGECNKVEEISMPKTAFSELRDSVSQAGFKLISPQLEMNCICHECEAS